MTAGLGDETASPAGGHGRQRASHSDREQVIEVLKAAFVQDRLTIDELDMRVGRAFTARTYAELAALTADIPAEPATAAPPRKPARPAGTRARIWVTAVAFLIALMSVAVATGGDVDRLAFVAVVIPLAALPLGGLLALHSWLDQRGTRQLPSGPGPGGPGLAGERAAGTGRDRALPGTRADDTRADLRTHPPRAAPSGEVWAPRGMRPAPGTI